MAARKTVTPNIEAINAKTKECGWSNAYFTGTLMGKGRGWTTEWKRGACYPSPKEAAQMCVLLNTAPEEILSKPEDIELVKGLLDQEREKSIKKDLPEEVQMSGAKREAWELIKSWDDDRIQKFIAAAKAMLGE